MTLEFTCALAALGRALAVRDAVEDTQWPARIIIASDGADAILVFAGDAQNNVWGRVPGTVHAEGEVSFAFMELSGAINKTFADAASVTVDASDLSAVYVGDGDERVNVGAGAIASVPAFIKSTPGAPWPIGLEPRPDLVREIEAALRKLAPTRLAGPGPAGR